MIEATRKVQPTSPAIWVIIVTYNGMTWIEHCLKSLLASSLPLNPLVIDNCSTDQTVAYIKENFPTTTLILNQKNLGFGEANNIGMRYAVQQDADYCFLMNQDAWIEPTTLTALIKAAEQNPQYGIISPIHLNVKGNALDYGFSQYVKNKSFSELKKLKEQIIETPFVNAAFWLLRKETIKKVGFFNSEFFFYCGEDVDYTNRIHYYGYKVGYVPKAIAYHDRPQNITTHEKETRNLVLFHLSEALNINKSLIASFLFGPIALLKRVLTSLAQGQSSDSKAYLIAWVKLLKQYKQILVNRKQYKQK